MDWLLSSLDPMKTMKIVKKKKIKDCTEQEEDRSTLKEQSTLIR